MTRKILFFYDCNGSDFMIIYLLVNRARREVDTIGYQISEIKNAVTRSNHQPHSPINLPHILINLPHVRCAWNPFGLAYTLGTGTGTHIAEVLHTRLFRPTLPWVDMVNGTQYMIYQPHCVHDNPLGLWRFVLPPATFTNQPAPYSNQLAPCSVYAWNPSGLAYTLGTGTLI